MGNRSKLKSRLEEFFVSNPGDAPIMRLHTFPRDDSMVMQCKGRLIADSVGNLHMEVKRMIPETKRITLSLIVRPAPLRSSNLAHPGC